MLKFFHGSSSGCCRQLIDECCRRIGSPSQSFIYVVPTARRARGVEKQLLEARPQGFFRPSILTFYSLVHLLYRNLGGTGVPISQAVKAILIEEIVCDPSLKLRYFAAPPSPTPPLSRPFPGLIAKLAAFISDLKQNLIDPDELERRLLHVEKSIGPKNRELIAIYRQYQKLLDKHKLIDTDGMFWLVLNELDKPGRLAEALGAVDLLIFDGFFDVTHAEGKVLANLIQQAPNVWLRVDWQPGAPAFAAADAFVQQFCTGERIELPPPPASPANLLAGQLFQPLPPPLPHSPTPSLSHSPTPPVTILECRDRLAEVEAIALEIKKLCLAQTPIVHRSSSIVSFSASSPKPQAPSLNRVAVAFKDVNVYAPLIREVFTACGIPFNCSSGRPLTESPVAAAILTVLRIIGENYSRDAVLTFLRSPYVHFEFDYEGNRRTLDGEFIDVEARAARIFRGKATWPAKLTELANRLEQEIGRTREADDPQRAAARLAKLREHAAGIALALDALSALASAAEPKDFRESFRSIIHRFGIARGVFFAHENRTDEDVLERDYRALSAIGTLLDDLTFAAGFSGSRRFQFADYAEMLEAGIAGEEFDVRRDVGHGVQIISAHEIRGGDYDVVFLGGLVEGEFPRPAGPQIFFSERRRHELGFKCEPSNLQLERYLFTTAVGAPTMGLVLSYPRSEDDRMLLRSLFVNEIERLMPGVQKRSYPEPQAIFSPKTLQHAIGAGLGGRDAERAEAALAIASQLTPQAIPLGVFRSLGIEEKRRRADKWTEFEGALADPAVRSIVANRYAESSFTVSRLERYAQCPFRFFAEHVAKLVELDKPEEEIDAIERGGLLHAILGRFYMERRSRGKIELDAHDDREAVLGHLVSVAHNEFDRQPFEGIFWEMERERIAGTAAHHGSPTILELFIDAEMADAGRCKPRFFEVTFGYGRADELTDVQLSLPELAFEGGGTRVRISGRIDRVEVAPDGSAAPAIVVDYKTGNPPHHTAIREYRSLQIPVYMMALEQDPHHRFHAIGGAYYCLKDTPKDFGKTFFGGAEQLRECCGVSRKKTAGLLDAKELAEVIGGARAKIIEYVAAIRSGIFNPSTLSERDAGCMWCIFRGVCRRELAKSLRMAQREEANA